MQYLFEALALAWFAFLLLMILFAVFKRVFQPKPKVVVAIEAAQKAEAAIAQGKEENEKQIARLVTESRQAKAHRRGVGPNTSQ